MLTRAAWFMDHRLPILRTHQLEWRALGLKAASPQAVDSAAQHKVSDRFPRTGLNVEVGHWTRTRIRTGSKERAKQNRTIVDIEFVEGVRCSPSEANVADRICHRHRDIERRTEKTVRYDEI